MFEFGSKINTKPWYYEGPDEVLRVTTVNSSSIDTSDIDQYRQGIEIQEQKHWTAGMLKIHAGETGHIIKQNIFGQDSNFELNTNSLTDSSWYEDASKFDPVKYVDGQDASYALPIILGDTNQIDGQTLNGVIEPLSIRSIVSFSSIDILEPHDIRATIMMGNQDILMSAEPLVHVHTYEPSKVVTPYLDMSDMMGSIQTVSYHDTSIKTIAPFVDKNTRESVLHNVVQSNPNDMNTALCALEFDTENYIPTGSVSPTSGFVFDNNTLGTDSLAFGGMIY